MKYFIFKGKVSKMPIDATVFIKNFGQIYSLNFYNLIKKSSSYLSACECSFLNGIVSF